MTPGIPDNLLEGDVVYLPWEKVGAKEHVPPGGDFHWPHETPFAVLAERVQSYVEISVADTGEGIAADFLPQLFERIPPAKPCNHYLPILGEHGESIVYRGTE